MEKNEEIIDILKAIGDNTRFNILKVLSTSGNNLCVTAISDRLGVSQPVISQHLKVLKNSGVVEAERMGYHIHYRINISLLTNISNQIMNLTMVVNECSQKEECNKNK